MSLFLQARPVEEDDEDEEERQIFETKHMCPCCQEYLTYTDEVYLLEITEAAKDGEQIATQPLLAEDGDYRYEPYILHFMCWEEVIEQMREAAQDQPPVECADGIMLCQICNSTIGNFEPFLGASYAEIYVSQRSPSGEKADKVMRFGGMDAICLACVVHVFEDHFEDWEDLFSDFNLGFGEDEDE